MKKVLIVGANFANKGAQSMLFTTICAVKKYNADSEIYFATNEEYDESLYGFKKVYVGGYSKELILRNKLLLITKSAVRDALKAIRGQKDSNTWKFMDLKRLLPQIDLIIDISGFNIGADWSVYVQNSYLDNIRLAKKYGIPMVILPQSFGPFNYGDDKAFLLPEIGELLRYPKIVFAREQEGYTLLREKFHLENVALSTDLVLQSKSIDKNLVFSKPIQMNLPNISNNAVGVVPNNHCFERENCDRDLALYQLIIGRLVEKEKEVYIFRHSSEDISSCKQIYKEFQNEKKVHLIENDFSCIEYDEFVKQFQFLICSRYHGIVHAYRNAIPCIVLGWAVKYNELADLLSQSKYFADIVSGDFDSENLVEILDNMISHCEEEKLIISEKLCGIQEDNCFKCLEQFL